MNRKIDVKNRFLAEKFPFLNFLSKIHIFLTFVRILPPGILSSVRYRCMKKFLTFFVLACGSYLSLPLFASPTADFSLDSLLSNLVRSEGILYTRTGSLSLSGTASSNVQTVEFSGVTLTGGVVYRTGGTLAEINSFFPSNTSLTGGTYVVSAFDGSGALLGSEQLIVDKTAPKAQKITYLDDNRNGKIDRLVIDFDEAPTGTLNLPYSTGMTVYTRK